MDWKVQFTYYNKNNFIYICRLHYISYCVNLKFFQLHYTYFRIYFNNSMYRIEYILIIVCIVVQNNCFWVLKMHIVVWMLSVCFKLFHSEILYVNCKNINYNKNMLIKFIQTGIHFSHCSELLISFYVFINKNFKHYFLHVWFKYVWISG